jgi:hypothetical protein
MRAFLVLFIMASAPAAVLISALYLLGRLLRPQCWTKAMVLAAASAAAIGATYTWWPDPDFAGGVAFYNVFFYYPLVIFAFASWGFAIGFYIVFLRREASKRMFKVVAPPLLLMPFLYESVLIVRHMLWLHQYV